MPPRRRPPSRRAARPATPSTEPPSGWPAAEVAAAVGATAPDEAAKAALGVWLDALWAWNRKIDLTAAKTERALLWLMLADALMLAGAIPEGASVVDVGAGAGAPGLALAILRPDLDVTLCEPLGKRAAFLRSVIGALGRTDVTLAATRVDRLERGRFDVAAARATFPPAEWLSVGAGLVRAGGSVWVFLAQGEPPARPGCSVAETLRYDDPTTGASKRLVRYVVAEGGGG
jgi:16S rRNA (guanine527-N7)-methyltransferase